MTWTIEERRAYKRKWNKVNRGRYAAQEAVWRKNNAERLDIARFRRNLLKLYGVALEDYERMFAEQQGLCALCSRHQRAFQKRFGVDHDHETTKVRALLCGPCNTALGLLQDDPALMRSAAKYVEFYR